MINFIHSSKNALSKHTVEIMGTDNWLEKKRRQLIAGNRDITERK